jgi:hypothetical protein
MRGKENRLPVRSARHTMRGRNTDHKTLIPPEANYEAHSRAPRPIDRHRVHRRLRIQQQRAGFGQESRGGGHKMAVAKIEPSKASATQPANGQAKGEIMFHQMGDKVHITGEISGLKPNAKHAIHIHEKGGPKRA